MKKLKLNLKDIQIESFETVKKEKKVKGTVVGFDVITKFETECPDTLYDHSCPGWTSCPNLPC
ncbi:MAG: hypothetical protein PVH88_07580 [Ignavibacteria bacterium]|jgi:hypothetical protein